MGRNWWNQLVKMLKVAVRLRQWEAPRKDCCAAEALTDRIKVLEGRPNTGYTGEQVTNIFKRAKEYEDSMLAIGFGDIKFTPRFTGKQFLRLQRNYMEASYELLRLCAIPRRLSRDELADLEVAAVNYRAALKAVAVDFKVDGCKMSVGVYEHILASHAAALARRVGSIGCYSSGVLERNNTRTKRAWLSVPKGLGRGAQAEPDWHTRKVFEKIEEAIWVSQRRQKKGRK